uniref:AraC family transcriptional regulator n=1 Tax=Ningiella ruwaisensis TaxID=2364274 RepID=UPI0014478653|nr:helix-turn-helix domain-containing protein [Ningiella ruwaisensis]
MDWPNLFLLIASCSLMLLQAVQKNKETKHYLFAIFCGSMVMVSLQNLSAPALGAYQHLIGLGACATCNMVWLISRSLFRDRNAIAIEHIAVAGVIAIMIMLNQTNAFLAGIDIHAPYLTPLKGGLSEVLNLLSSTVLALTFWEALRQFSCKSKQEKLQRLVFAGAFIFGLSACMVYPAMVQNSVKLELIMPYLMACSAFAIMLSIQIILMLQAHQSRTKPEENLHEGTERQSLNPISSMSFHSIEPSTIIAIEKLISDEQIFLKPNLKIIDIAQAINEPEYKVSRAIRHHFKSQNFNAFINYHRIEHAKHLLSSDNTKAWSMLVISLESGFSSLVTFNRAFKSSVGLLPSEYKKHRLI